MKGVYNRLIDVMEGSSEKGGEHYELSFNSSKMSFYASDQLSQNTVVSRFNDSYSLPWEDGVNKIYITLHAQNVSKLNINVKLPKTNISKKEIIERIEKMEKPEASFSGSPKITNLFTLDKGLVLVKGLYPYVTNEATMDGCEHPYFAIFSTSNGKSLIIDNYALLRVLSIDGKYYFVTHFQKPESCARGLVIYRLEKDGLTEAFLYYKDDLKRHGLNGPALKT
ncbi:MAG: hypothetical protein A3I73_00910 [Omnitrophica bacterium RIFCSPLOWO2_02_FULL_45_16]|nr:MAG: hypothetical protein A3C51_04340 [Omnitrophica bacterium RIFCSPHIGHO2_02_FULL_46_20]OGX00765.1 MAG: hypothetical protein A3I73_00910 [Omnitrophica bacterium RIFCSPLOWO2_02_FULL_45_16]